MCRDCILVLFLPLYLNLHTNIQTKLPFTKYLSSKQMKQTTHQVSCQSLLNHGNFSAGLYIKQGSSRGSLQRFFSSSLQLNRSIILPYLRTDGEGTSPPPCSILLAQCVCCRTVTETLPPCFMPGET